MRLSYSSIDTYENCPAKWRFQKVEELPREASPALSFGSSLHLALERFHGRPVPVAPSLPELLDLLDAVWIPDGYADEAEEQRYLDHAREVLTRYHADNSHPFILPAAIEQRFSIEIEGVTISGQIDRMDRLPGGGYEIIDYKSNRKLPPLRTIERNLQLSIYHLAARELWGIDPERLTMYYVVHGQRLSTSRTAADLDAVRRRIATVAERIDAGKFEANPNPLCNWCSFQKICPAMRHRTERSDGRADAEIAGLVDEWVTLQGERRELDARIDAIGARLRLFAAEHDYRRLYASDGSAAERRRRELPADPELVRALLEPLGRYEDVLSVDPVKLSRVVGAGDLPPEAEDALLAGADDAPFELAYIPPPRKAPPVAADPAVEPGENEGGEATAPS